jgi:hypothetical protein
MEYKNAKTTGLVKITEKKATRVNQKFQKEILTKFLFQPLAQVTSLSHQKRGNPL